MFFWLIVAVIVGTAILVVLEFVVMYFDVMEIDKDYLDSKVKIFRRKFQDGSVAEPFVSMKEENAVVEFKTQIKRYHRKLRLWKYAVTFPLSLVALSGIYLFEFLVETGFLSGGQGKIIGLIGFFSIIFIGLLLYLKSLDVIRGKYRERGFEEYMLTASLW